jgi:hypothetical protein
MALNLRLPIKVILSGAKGTVLIFRRVWEFGAYGGGYCHPLARHALSFKILILNPISYTHTCACVQGCLLICVYKRSIVQMNTFIRKQVI